MSKSPQPAGHRRCHAAAVIVHWGDPSRTLALVAQLCEQPAFDRIVVVANDGTPIPPGAPRSCPATKLDWVVPSRNLGYGGAALFARSEVVHDVRFDGSYFLGYEDSDLCEQAAHHGWATLCVSNAVGVHAGYTTIAGPRWQYYSIRNRIWFCRRRRSRVVTTAAWLWLVLFMLPRVMIADVVKRRGLDRSRSVIWGVVDGSGRLPTFGEIRRDEPVPQRWLRW